MDVTGVLGHVIGLRDRIRSGTYVLTEYDPVTGRSRVTVRCHRLGRPTTRVPIRSGHREVDA